jgi:hypothetical protein
MKRTLAALALGLALATAPIPRVKADTTLSLGVSSPCYGLLAFKGVLEGEHLGIQTEIGKVITSLDLRYKTELSDAFNLYNFAGVIGISPWRYDYPKDSSKGLVFGLELGAGFEFGRKKGLSLGIEGGFIIPIPIDQNSRAFRFDFNLMYRIPLKK